MQCYVMYSDPPNKYWRQNRKEMLLEMKIFQMEDWQQYSQQRHWPVLLYSAIFSVSQCSCAPYSFLIPLANLNQIGQDWHLAPPEFYCFSGSQMLSGCRKLYHFPPRKTVKLSVTYFTLQQPAGCPAQVYTDFSTRTCIATACTLQVLASCPAWMFPDI